MGIFRNIANNLSHGGWKHLVSSAADIASDVANLPKDVREITRETFGDGGSAPNPLPPLTTGPGPVRLPTRDEHRARNRQLEKQVERINPKIAEKLRQLHARAENHEDMVKNLEETVRNFLESQIPLKLLLDHLAPDAREKGIHASDHLYVQRTGYSHHGLYVGDKAVIHYLVEEGVILTSLAEFACGAKIHIENSPKTHTKDAIVRRAFRRVYEREYNLLFNNCEHFVHWCRSGND